MNYIPLCLFVSLSAINIRAFEKKWYKLGAITKFTLAPLALLNVLINTNFAFPTRVLLIIVYSFYLIGDIFLLSKKTIFFTIGLTSFLLGHICFIIIFLINATTTYLVPFAIIALIYPIYNMSIITKDSGKLKLPMRLYMIFMSIFITTSTLLGNPLFIIATSIFTISDSFIAINYSYKKNRFNNFYIMITYSLALILLSTAMIIFYIY